MKSIRPLIMGETTVLIIDPDAKNWCGHYMAYNEKLTASFQKQKDDDFKIADFESGWTIFRWPACSQL